ncbi:tRNA (guanosine(37)-N1)-methyltransferase TrmD [Saccharopolyspora mangrovi]|uniref:tRNA (guanine-N(1)-)-methyltransferase n=1 Tax=Saccharopolyspora mangrovi TaxID=3082379 RepID=A0ABU6A5P2_9PSEU|nr:tRNA (guanosine(37)-N1)-methyltransferase TrmD [Saccharopolyspora sp. S2-29]MEB3366851.1 tRNA (guanosine(37)-N1)-methyltransferase TrmD [Saccharopolyspora sp. S2-29]
MRIDVITIFPDYLNPLREALLGKAIERERISVGVHDLRDWTHDVHRAVDDSPYGGGPGMVMKPDVWGEALDEVCGVQDATPRLVVPTPAGRPFEQKTAVRWSQDPWLVFACGRYEGIDQRVIDDAATRMSVEEVSIGDYVLVGGEVAALTMIEAVVRLLPGVLGNPLSAEQDSFSDGLLEGPCYTRPEVWRDRPVPDVLRSGNHAAIARWRRDQALERTYHRRPELLAALPEGDLDKADRKQLDKLRASDASDGSSETGDASR